MASSRREESPWRLLVVVGFDATSREALLDARERADAMGLALQVLHVLLPTPGPVDAEASKRKLLETLRAWVEFEGGFTLPSAAFRVERGELVDCVVRVCNEGVAFVIVGQLPDSIDAPGQLVERLLDLCPCPVVVRDRARLRRQSVATSLRPVGLAQDCHTASECRSHLDALLISGHYRRGELQSPSQPRPT
jgi:nucleotide-binding universal stress UspA family protein